MELQHPHFRPAPKIRCMRSAPLAQCPLNVKTANGNPGLPLTERHGANSWQTLDLRPWVPSPVQIAMPQKHCVFDDALMAGGQRLWSSSAVRHAMHLLPVVSTRSRKCSAGSRLSRFLLLEVCPAFGFAAPAACRLIARACQDLADGQVAQQATWSTWIVRQPRTRHAHAVLQSCLSGFSRLCAIKTMFYGLYQCHGQICPGLDATSAACFLQDPVGLWCAEGQHRCSFSRTSLGVSQYQQLLVTEHPPTRLSADTPLAQRTRWLAGASCLAS